MHTNLDKTLTAANSVVLMRVKGYNDSYVQLQGFAADNIFESGTGAIGETVMGADGIQSGGWTPHELDFNIQLQANSPSRAYLNGVTNTFNKNQETAPVEFMVSIPSIGQRHYLTGFMVSYGGDSAKKLMQPITYSFKVVPGAIEDM